MKTRIPIKKHVFDPSKTWEESYRLLEAHHEEETEFLIGRIGELEGPVTPHLQSGDRYFMAAVSLIGAQRRIERILEDLAVNKLPPSMELMSACIAEVTEAMTCAHRYRLSDDRFRVKPGCERGCGYTAEHHVCQLGECAL